MYNLQSFQFYEKGWVVVFFFLNEPGNVRNVQLYQKKNIFPPGLYNHKSTLVTQGVVIQNTSVLTSLVTSHDILEQEKCTVYFLIA